MRIITRLLLSTSVLVVVAACGSTPTDPMAAPAGGNDQRVVAGDDDAVEADGTIELTSAERSTCSDYIAIIGKGHEALAAEAESGSSGAGFSGGTNVPQLVQQLTPHLSKATTPEFVEVLTRTVAAGQDAYDLAMSGQAPTAEDYDAAALATGLSDAAALCESAGINITWF